MYRTQGIASLHRNLFITYPLVPSTPPVASPPKALGGGAGHFHNQLILARETNILHTESSLNSSPSEMHELTTTIQFVIDSKERNR